MKMKKMEEMMLTVLLLSDFPIIGCNNRLRSKRLEGAVAICVQFSDGDLPRAATPESGLIGENWRRQEKHKLSLLPNYDCFWSLSHVEGCRNMSFG
jgi:hypothetical protein